jgi:hypothetical protein
MSFQGHEKKSSSKASDKRTAYRQIRSVAKLPHFALRIGD